MDVLTREGKQEKNLPIIFKWALRQKLWSRIKGLPAFRSGLKVVVVVSQDLPPPKKKDLSSLSGL